jgi:ubiquinone/menaquinone biosynthesis C-methylase UbiE
VTKRIPHSDDAILGEESMAVYVENHKKNLNSHFKTFLKDLESLNMNGRFLEIGSGPGFLTALVAKKNPNARITALELSPEMIHFARNHIQEEGVEDRVRFIQGNAESPGMLQSLGPFDLVYSTFSLHHWKRPLRVIKNLYHIVSDKGALLIHDLIRVWWLYHLPPKNGFFESIRAAYAPKEIRRMFEQLDIHHLRLKIPFPYFWMSAVVQKNAV